MEEPGQSLRPGTGTDVLKGYPLCPTLANSAFGCGAGIGDEAKEAVVHQLQGLGDINQLAGPAGSVGRRCCRRVNEFPPGQAANRFRRWKLKCSWFRTGMAEQQNMLRYAHRFAGRAVVLMPQPLPIGSSEKANQAGISGIPVHMAAFRRKPFDVGEDALRTAAAP